MGDWESIQERVDCLTCGSKGTQYIDVSPTGEHCADVFLCDNEDCQDPESQFERDYNGG